MECPICRDELADDAQKCWLVEEAGDALNADVRVDPTPVCRPCAKQMVSKRGALGRKVIGFKTGASKPEPGGLILRS
ncbi:MAG TPA: hypothetical protein VFV38_35865 [Ktedonobacteraceae bacterium]|nr:hypothetical protein [Ktedonobacteraceae bacterium]